MNVSLFQNLSDRNRISKTIRNGIGFNGTLRESSNVISPVITIETTDNLSEYNYAWIPDFNRYYYIDEMTAVRKNIWQITLSVDVLMSFRGDILNVVGIVDKQESTRNGSPYIDDNSLVVSSERFNQTISFPAGFSATPYYILATAGAVI